MGDRIPYMVGNTASRDVSNWPTILRDEIAGVIGALTEDQINAQWPVDITREQITAISWRVKKWEITGEASCDLTQVRTLFPFTTRIWTGNADVTGDIMAIKFDGSNVVPATRELDLIYRVFDTTYQALVGLGVGVPTGALLDSDWSVVESGDFSASYSGNAGVSFGLLGQFTIYDPAVLFAPAVTGFGPPPSGQGGNVIPSVTLGNPLELTISPFKTPITVGSGSGALLLKSPGVIHIDPLITPPFDIPLQLAWRLAGMDNNANYSGTGEAEFTLTATEFWPYANTENAAVWDTSSGAQLVNPFS